MNSPNSSPIIIPQGTIDIPPIAPIISTTMHPMGPPPCTAKDTPNNEDELICVEGQVADNSAILEQLFAEANLAKKYEERCSSLDYFNNKAFGGRDCFKPHDDKIDHPLYPEFKRYSLHELSSVLEQGQQVDFRFVVIKNNTSAEILFSQGLGGSNAMSHGQLACKKETYGSCVAAGEISFIAENGQWHVRCISNKSGHFKGEVATLIAPLLLLIEDPVFPFSPMLTISQYIKGSINDVEVSFAELRNKYDERVLKTSPNLDDQRFVQLAPRVETRTTIDVLAKAETHIDTPVLTTTGLFSQGLFSQKRRLETQDCEQEAQDNSDLVGHQFLAKSRPH